MRGKSTLTATPKTSTARLPRLWRAKLIVELGPGEFRLLRRRMSTVALRVTLGVTLRDYADGRREGGGGATWRPESARRPGQKRGNAGRFSGGVVRSLRLDI